MFWNFALLWSPNCSFKCVLQLQLTTVTNVRVAELWGGDQAVQEECSLDGGCLYETLAVNEMQSHNVTFLAGALSLGQRGLALGSSSLQLTSLVSVLFLDRW